MKEWLLDNMVGITGILIGSFATYHIYFLSRKITFQNKMSHIEQIKNDSYKILNEVRKGISRKVEIINISKYRKHYPHNNEHNRQGYTYLGAEIKGPRYNGVEFFCDMPQSLYVDENNYFTLKKTDKVAEFYAYPVGLVPYEWIEFVDTNGDEFSYRPQFFTRFNGKGRYPYKEIKYYKKSEVYNKDNDPIEMEYVEKIDILSGPSWFVKLIRKLRVR